MSDEDEADPILFGETSPDGYKIPPRRTAPMADALTPEKLDELERYARNRTHQQAAVTTKDELLALIAAARGRDRLRVDSANYNSKCSVCCTPNSAMLTDEHCAVCERDAAIRRAEVTEYHEDDDGCVTWTKPKGYSMKASQVAAELLKTPDATVYVRRNRVWGEVAGVSATGHHRNGVTFEESGQDAPCPLTAHEESELVRLLDMFKDSTEKSTETHHARQLVVNYVKLLVCPSLD